MLQGSPLLLTTYPPPPTPHPVVNFRPFRLHDSVGKKKVSASVCVV